jgi:exopolysaccharide production protein ExoZ
MQRLPKKLDLLEVCRGFAACAVVFHHIPLLLAEPRYGGAGPLASAFFPGYHGVDFFFVLSGFIITYAHQEDIGKPRSLRRYAWRRFVRVIPIYWIVTSALVAIYLTFPHLGEPRQHDLLVIAKSYFLIPAPELPVLGVAWTLRFEALFYTLFVLLILNRRLGTALFVAWFVVIALGYGKADFPVSFFLSDVNVQFLMGMVGCLVLKRLPPWRPFVLAGGGLGLIVLLYILEAIYAPTFEGVGLAYHLRDVGSHFAYGIAACLTIVGLAQIESAARQRIPSLLLGLGRASYSIYLTHGLLLSLTATVLFKSGFAANLGRIPLAGVLAAAAIAGGYLFYASVERPLLRILRGASRARSSDRSPLAPMGTTSLRASSLARVREDS